MKIKNKLGFLVLFKSFAFSYNNHLNLAVCQRLFFTFLSFFYCDHMTRQYSHQCNLTSQFQVSCNIRVALYLFLDATKIFKSHIFGPLDALIYLKVF